MRITSTRFERSAHRPEDEPRESGPDVVFLGRSNVGKSSLINRLLGAPGLARTSSRPGRTQSVNYYRVNEDVWFVDLPGYGWAKVPEAVRASFKPLVEGYLKRRRERLALALLVVDARHAASELDLTMQEWLEATEAPYLIAATKADKLNRAGRVRTRQALLEGFRVGGVANGPVLVSAERGEGMRELWRHLDAALETWRARGRAGSGRRERMTL